MQTIVFGANNETLPGASVFESGADGIFMPGGSAMITDDNGVVNIPDGLPFVTFRNIGYVQQTFAGYNVPAQVTLQVDVNILDAVNITAAAGNDWLAIALFVACFILIVFILTS